MFFMALVLVKGIVHPKMKILSLITHPHVVLKENENNYYSTVRLLRVTL